MPASKVKGSVLIIDDNEQWRATISQLLKLRGYVSAQASNLPSAMQALGNQYFDIVTIDMDFGEQGNVLGETVLEVIRTNYPHIACIMISGSDSITFSKVFDLQDELGLHAFVHKSELTPTNLEEAITRAKRKVQQRQAATEQATIAGNVSEAQPQSRFRPSVFISYSHRDEAEKDELVSHLGVLASEGLVDVWVDDEIEAGGDWFKDIDQAISRAKVAILLITKNSLTSKFILNEEIPRLLDRRKRQGLVVFPVIARPCAWTRVKWLSEMNVKPKNGTPVWREGGRFVDDELALIAETVADILERAAKS